jgi:hypothetical protein
MPDNPQALTQWTAALDALEANLARVKDWMACVDAGACKDLAVGGCGDLEELTILARDDSVWRVRDGLPEQIPLALIPRAQSIAMRQTPVRTDLRDRITRGRKERIVRRPLASA